MLAAQRSQWTLPSRALRLIALGWRRAYGLVLGNSWSGTAGFGLFVLQAEQHQVDGVGLLQPRLRVGAPRPHLRKVRPVQHGTRNPGGLDLADDILDVLDSVVLQAEPKWALRPTAVQVRVVALALDLLHEVHHRVARDLPEQVRQMKLVGVPVRNPARQRLQRVVSNGVLVKLQAVAFWPLGQEGGQMRGDTIVRDVGIAGQVDVEDIVAMLLCVVLHEGI
mmetsp:Transcript_7486/g.21247  ORF Transcript_7486/g.21247 Transcript_7486/m.21247 type:complete len:222 (-) Transcript_7486:520-1185(-)